MQVAAGEPVGPRAHFSAGKLRRGRLASYRGKRDIAPVAPRWLGCAASAFLMKQLPPSVPPDGAVAPRSISFPKTGEVRVSGGATSPPSYGGGEAPPPPRTAETRGTRLELGRLTPPSPRGTRLEKGRGREGRAPGGASQFDAAAAQTGWAMMEAMSLGRPVSTSSRMYMALYSRSSGLPSTCNGRLSMYGEAVSRARNVKPASEPRRL